MGQGRSASELVVKLFIFCYLFSQCIIIAVDAQTPVVVQTANGKLRGFELEGTNYFLGVPFAAPPVGSLRWKPPQSASSWSGIRDAFRYGPSCVQAKPSAPIPGWNVSEDCLYLNVYAPAGAKNLPVMVWIYGGSFTSGAGEFYNGTSLVNINGQQGGVVVVNFNYRLGPFGFLSLPELKNETASLPTTGLYGIQDQRAALQWVKTNIANFGGNPKDITLFGESAGAISTCVHVAAPRSRGLFNKALLESGFCQIWPLDTSEAQGTQFADVVGCSDERSNPEQFLECLRNVDTNTVFNALPSNATWFPVVDGYELTQQPLKYLEDGNFSLDSLLMGVNKNEDSLFLCPKYANISATQYPLLLLNFFGVDVGKQVLQLYPLSSYPTPIEALINIFSDNIFKCPAKFMADAISSHGVPAYFYSFEHLPGFAVNQKCLGIAHSFELPFIFPSLLPAYSNSYVFTANEQKLSEFMRTSWTTFARTNSPNEREDAWPLFKAPSADYIILNEPVSQGANLLPIKCEFWRNHQCKIGSEKCN